MERTSRRHLSVLVIVVAAVLAGCGTVAPSQGGSPPAAGSPSPSAGASVTTPEEAAQRVVETNPDFAGIGPVDPDMIGGCCFYEVTEEADRYVVTFEVGWGDCMAGCINKHRWTYAVGRGGDVALLEETGPSIPPGGVPPG